MPCNTEKVRLTYTSKHNFKSENHVILLIITGAEKLHYLTVKILPALFRGITSNLKGDFYYSNCFHSYSTKEKVNVYLKKCTCVKIILKNLTQKKNLNVRLLVIRCVQIVHLMQPKISWIVKEAKIVWKSLEKI